MLTEFCNLARGLPEGFVLAGLGCCRRTGGIDVKIFGGRATQELTVAIFQHLGVHPGRADIFKFSNDNTFVRILENVREADVFVVQTSAPPSMKLWSSF